ncbi:hypothetical protein AcV7_008583 [Taiwanofungus camphoratus]|nr:hypothetical protein AcV7_008583 [Antrodia cinnamomea]
MPERPLLVQIASYNTNLQADRGLPQDLVDWLSPTLQASSSHAQEYHAPDIVAVGFQELLPLHLGLSGLSSPIIESRNALILSQIEAHSPNKERYSLIAKVVNVGVALLVYGRDEGVARRVYDVQTQWTGCGPAYMGNKGAVGVRFRVSGEGGGAGETYTFVCAHLTAHAYHLAHRIHDYHHIVGTLLFDPLPASAQQLPTTMYSTSHLFFFGDLNFRLDIPSSELQVLEDPTRRDNFLQALSNEQERQTVKEWDQLTIERDVKGTIFRSLREGEFWKFKCSYKYRLGEADEFDLERTPAWTDRIMYTTYSDSPDLPRQSNITNLLYTTVPSYTTSDHKPIVSLLLVPPSTPSSSDSTPPVLRLPADYSPRPDPFATVKKYTGRTLDRLIGYCWWFLTLVGAGSAVVGIANFVVSLGLWGWWKWKSPRNT